MQKYDYLLVGAGLFNATLSSILTNLGKRVAVVEQRDHIGGNCYTKNIEGIEVHYYGAHIFHTSNKEVWDFVNSFGEFNDYKNTPIAIVNGQTYNLPFNMNLFSKVFKTPYPEEIKNIIARELGEFKDKPIENLEDQALSMVGRTIYEMFIKGYTEKQWGKKCTELPPEIIKRLPLRWTYDNNYFNDTYQGIPKEGYTKIIERMFEGSDIYLNTPFESNHGIIADKIIYTGMIDRFFDYKYGPLEYRTLDFIHQIKDTDNWQGNAVFNYPTNYIPYTRSIEHKHFNYKPSNKTVVSFEFSKEFNHKDPKQIPYYPIGNKENKEKYSLYLKEAEKIPEIIFAGRLGEYQYYDMDDTIENALKLSEKLIK